MALVGALAACGGGGTGGDSGSAVSVSAPVVPVSPVSGPAGTPAHVAITAMAPVTLIASGSTVLLDLIVTNSGTLPASNVAVSTQLGVGLTQSAVTCSAAGTAVCPTNAQTMQVASLPGQSSLHFQVSASIAPGTRGAVAASATVRADNQTVSSDSTGQVTISTYTADVSVAGTGPSATVASGGNAAYVMTVSNAGPDLAMNVGIENSVGQNQSLVSISCTATGGAVCPATLDTAMTIPSLPIGGRVVFTITAQVSAAAIGVISDTLYANPAGDPVAGNNVATVMATTSISTTGTTSFVVLQSDPGDYVGQGLNYAYRNANAVISLTANGSQLVVRVNGDKQWYGSFGLPGGLSQLQPGTYSNLQRFGFYGPGGIDWSGDGRGCNTVSGTIVVDAVNYVNGNLASIDMRFEEHCEGLAPALRGQIHWLASDASQPPGPVSPPPANLWRAPSGTVPATGNYVYLQSESGDYIGQGATQTYTQANAVLSLGLPAANRLHVNVAGNDGWDADFAAMSNLASLQPGYYGNLQRYPFQNPARGGMSWSGNGRGCNTLTAWFVIDSISYVGGSLASIDLRFEQHCEGGSPALHGQIHWVNGDPTKPAGPVNPPPAGLWTPASGATPISGNYVYLASDSGDYIGNGQTNLYTPTTASVSVTGSGTKASLLVNSFSGWTGEFVAMNSIAQLVPGYYGNLQRYPFNNATAGGMSWSGYGRGCNTLSGWFVVDSVSYVGGNLASIDLRFEQHCEGSTPALRGKIHWIN